MPCELQLVRDWDTAWVEVVRPWLEVGGGLRRDYVIVPTRGQAHALKLRCVREDCPLIGVEFLTPRLARRKWHALAPPARPAMGRELLLLNLRDLVERRLAPLRPGEAAWGFWKSLQSDAERALRDFDELLQAGFSAADLPPPLAELFGELTDRVAATGYGLSPVDDIAAGLAPPAPDAAPLGERLLIHGFDALNAPDFFALAAIARRSRDVTVLVPEPELLGRGDAAEAWVEAWSALLGVEAKPAPLAGAEPAGEAVARLWLGAEPPAAAAPPGAALLVGQTRADEMVLVADEVIRLLNAGADNVAVLFPRAGAAHQRLTSLLAARRVPFNDLVESAGPPPAEVRLQRALLAFHDGGGRLEELLALWPLLRTLNHTTASPADARGVAERAFDERQTHSLAALRDLIAARARPEWREVARVADRLLPAWPEHLTMADALDRFEALGRAFNLPLPEAWPTLREYARRDPRLLVRRIVVAAIGSFLPETTPVPGAPGRGLFAPVTLTTFRRATGVAWSHAIFVQGNHGVWPVRTESSCWLPDERRERLNRRSRFSLGLLTGDARAALERQQLGGIARNVRHRVVFTAALFDEEEPELMLAPNAWVERVLLHGGAERGLEDTFAGLACTTTPVRRAEASAWFEVWCRRRDPAQPFDEYFLGGPPEQTRPDRLAARLIERAAADPAELWFGAVLGIERVGWEPFVRARRKSLGSLAHRLLARALRGAPVEGVFGRRPAPEAARERLAAGLADLREQWPPDRYWESFHAELALTVEGLLEKVLTLGDAPFIAVETSLPPGTTIPLGEAGEVEVAGRLDLALATQPRWAGAEVDIVDFKTGADAKLAAAAMARGASLQLGVYLAAVRSLGAAAGRVWMVKPGGAKPASLAMSELAEALAPLAQLGRHLATGRYGALTPDRTDFSRGFAWPIACVPIRQEVLRKKFARTFGVAATVAAEVSDE